MNYYKEYPLFTSPLLANEEDKTIPGSIRKAENFLNFLKRAIMYLKHKIFLQPSTKLKEEKRECISPLRIQYELYYEQFIDKITIQQSLIRLAILFYTLKIKNIKKYKGLVKVLDFLILVTNNSIRFAIYKDPYPDFKKYKQIRMLIQLSCLDPAVTFKPIEEYSRNIIITSGNLTPTDIYSKLLEVTFNTIKSFTLDPQLKTSFCPLVISKANDNVSYSFNQQ
jgi:DNA excision repair protein ERCC-2